MPLVTAPDVERRAGEEPFEEPRRPLRKDTDAVANVIVEKVPATDGRISAKRLLDLPQDEDPRPRIVRSTQGLCAGTAPGGKTRAFHGRNPTRRGRSL